MMKRIYIYAALSGTFRKYRITSFVHER